MDKIIKRVVEAREKGVIVYVNATPGFKAESSFLTIASLLAGANAITYIHGTLRKLVILLSPPTLLDYRLINKLLKHGDKNSWRKFSKLDRDVQ